jgi:hypothetical protein
VVLKKMADLYSKCWKFGQKFVRAVNCCSVADAAASHVLVAIDIGYYLRNIGFYFSQDSRLLV